MPYCHKYPLLSNTLRFSNETTFSLSLRKKPDWSNFVFVSTAMFACRSALRSVVSRTTLTQHRPSVLAPPMLRLRTVGTREVLKMSSLSSVAVRSMNSDSSAGNRWTSRSVPTQSFNTNSSSSLPVPLLMRHNNTEQDGRVKEFTKTDAVVVVDERPFLKRMYMSVGGSVSATFALAYSLSVCAPVWVEMNTLTLIGGGFIGGFAALGGFFCSSYITTVRDVVPPVNAAPRPKHTRLIERVAINSWSRRFFFCCFVGAKSLMLTPFVLALLTTSPFIMPAAVGLTTIVMGVASRYAFLQPPGSMERWEGPLIGGLVGLLGMGIVGIGSHIAFGPNVLSQMLFTLEPYVGIAVFTGLTSFETQRALDEYYSGRNSDHLESALQLYLNFLNLFIRIAEIMARIGGSSGGSSSGGSSSGSSSTFDIDD